MYRGRTGVNLKLALRRLVKTPFVSIVAIISLALGIGANAAIFSLFEQTLLRALPVPRPTELVSLSAPGPKPGSNSCGQAGGCEDVFSYPMFRDLERVQTVFTGIAAHVPFGVALAYHGQTRSSEGMLVSGSYFPVLGLQPALGRLLGPDDDRNIGGHFVTVLSYGYWATRLGANPAVLNDTIVINGQSLTIVGVAPRGIQRNDARNGSERVRADLDARVDGPGMERIRQPQVVLGVPVRTAEAGHVDRSGARDHERVLPGDRERRGSPAAEGHKRCRRMARFKARQLIIEPGSRGQSSVHREARVPMMFLLAVTGDRADDCVRQHRQPPPRQGSGPGDGDGCPAFDWRQPPPSDDAAAHGVVRARRARRHRRPCRCPVDTRAHLFAAAARGLRIVQFELHCERRRVRRGLVARDRASLRPLPRAPQHQAGSRVRHQGAGRAAVGRACGGAVQDLARDRADRAVDGVAHGGRAVREEPRERQPCRSRAQGRQRRDVRDFTGTEWLRPCQVDGLLRTDRAGTGEHSWCHGRGGRDGAAAGRQQLGQ